MLCQNSILFFFGRFIRMTVLLYYILYALLFHTRSSFKQAMSNDDDDNDNISNVCSFNAFV